MKMRLEKIFFILCTLFKSYRAFFLAFIAAFILSSCSQVPAEYVDNSSRVYGKGGKIAISRPALQSKNPSHDHSSRYDDSRAKDDGIWKEEELSDNSYNAADQFENYNELLGDSNNFALSNPMGNASFTWPVSGKVVQHYNKAAGVEGINIGAAFNTPVRVSANGRAIYVGEDLSEYGKLVIVKHDNDILTAYGHLNSFMVKKGDIVKQGQILGSIGKTGEVESPQLHFSIRKDDKTINPEIVL